MLVCMQVAAAMMAHEHVWFEQQRNLLLDWVEFYMAVTRRLMSPHHTDKSIDACLKQYAKWLKSIVAFRQWWIDTLKEQLAKKQEARGAKKRKQGVLVMHVCCESILLFRLCVYVYVNLFNTLCTFVTLVTCCSVELIYYAGEEPQGTTAAEVKLQKEIAGLEANLHTVPPKVHAVVHLLMSIALRGPLSATRTDRLVSPEAHNSSSIIVYPSGCGSAFTFVGDCVHNV
jgi:hypothetical protein